MDCSLPGSSIHGTSQARVLEWVAIAFSIIASVDMSLSKLGYSEGQGSLVHCSPWGCKESDTTERLDFHFSFSCTGEGNGNPLQCSCLENPRDRGASWAAIYGVTRSRTRLKQRSSSSSSSWLFIASNRDPCRLSQLMKAVAGVW